MDSENTPRIDINQADEETLAQLHGIGSRLAKKIIAARPFESVEELRRVRGLSERDVERLRSRLTLEQASPAAEAAEVVEAEAIERPPDELPEAQAVEASEQQEEAAETVFDESEIAAAEVIVAKETRPGPDSEPAKEEVVFEPIPVVELEEAAEEPLGEAIFAEPKPVAKAPADQPKSITRAGTLGLIFFSCFFTLIFAIAITLGILSSLNRGQLTYASPSQVTTIQSQLNSLALQAETLSGDLEGVRTRLDNLEALSGRVNDLETEIANIQGSMDALQADIDSTQAQYEELVRQFESVNAEIETLKTQSSRFESFFQGLRDLLSGLFPNTQE